MQILYIGSGFELAKNAETFAEIMEEPLKWMSDEEKKKFDEYLSGLLTQHRA